MLWTLEEAAQGAHSWSGEDQAEHEDELSLLLSVCVLDKELSASAAASPFPALGIADGFAVATGQRVARSPAGFCWAADKGKRGTRHISLSVSPTGKYLRNKNAQNMLCAAVTSKAQGL